MKATYQRTFSASICVENHQVSDEEKNFFFMKMNQTLNGAENDVGVRGRYH